MIDAYAAKLLSDGETVLRMEHRHRFVLRHDALRGAITIVAALVLLAGGTVLGGPAGTIGLVAGLGLMALSGPRLVWHYLRWRNEVYLLTNWRVVVISGVFNKHVVDSSLEKINDAVLDSTFFGRRFGYGTLHIMTASDSVIDVLDWLPQPEAFKRAMQDAKHALGGMQAG